MTIPELEPYCGSWMVTAPSGQVFETFHAETAARCAVAGWKVETAVQYLGRINREIREACNQ